MPESDTVFFGVIPDSQSGTDETSVKSQSAEGKERFDGISYKIIPGLQAVKDLGAGKTEYSGKDSQVPHPVMRPDPYFSFLRRLQLLLAFFPPFQAHKKEAYQDTGRPAPFGGHDKILWIGGKRAIRDEEPNDLESQ